MAKEIKKLTPAELKKQMKKMDEVREFTVNIGGVDYKLEHDVVFRKTKQHKVLDDIVELFNAGSKRIEVLEMATPYTALLVFKHFTSLDVPDNVEEALDLLSVLIDLEVVDKILNELPEDQLIKTYELLTATINNMNQNLADAEREAQELSETVENDELKNELKEMLKNDE